MLVALLFGGAQPVDALPAAGSLDAAPAGGLLAPSHVRFRSASNLTLAETTVALQQGLNGYTGGHDTTIYQYNPDNSENYRWQAQLKVGYKQQYASILRFDLSSIPPNATITQATLQLFAEGWSGSAVSLGAYLITRSTTVHQATWNSAQTGYPWAAPGANHVPSDRLSSPHSSVTVSSIGGWSSLDLTQAVQDWISTNRPNNGILLRATLGTSSVHFSSAQCPAIGNRPRLVVTYQSGTSPEPELSSSPTPTSTRTNTPTPTQGDQGLSLVIGHLTDAHIGGNWVYEQRLPTTLQVVSKRVQVIVDTGDCTEDGTASQSSLYVDIMRSNATVPWRAVPGNHDTPHEFSKAMGPLQWSWDVAGYRLIGINTEDIDYTALDNSLTHEKPCIVFGHFPLSWCDPTDQYKLRLRFRAYSVPIYIAGHTHLDSLQLDRESGTLLLTGQRAGLGHYRIVTLRDSGVVSVSFEGSWD